MPPACSAQLPDQRKGGVDRDSPECNRTGQAYGNGETALKPLKDQGVIDSLRKVAT